LLSLTRLIEFCAAFVSAQYSLSPLRILYRSCWRMIMARIIFDNPLQALAATICAIAFLY
jgi:hypothetical protein